MTAGRSSAERWASATTSRLKGGSLLSHEWNSFLWAADQWIIAYSLPPANLIAVKLFAAGHALELYLKACFTKMTGDLDGAIKVGHDLASLWSACKANDPAFLPNRELRLSILATNLLDGKVYSQLPRDDLLHLMQNQELYVVSKHLADMKYIGAPLKSIKGAYSLPVFFPNPLWVQLFKDLRTYLSYPENKDLDHIYQAIAGGELPAASSQYLAPLVS